jgi:hypothetical protein
MDGRGQPVVDRLQALVRRDTSAYPLVIRGTGPDSVEKPTLEEFLAILKAARRHSRPEISNVLVAVAYLGQHLEGSVERTGQVVGLVRRYWHFRDREERDWFGSYWPDARPDGPSSGAVRAPDTLALNTWVRSSRLFESRPVSKRRFDT